MSKWAIAAIGFAAIAVALAFFYFMTADRVYAVDAAATKAELLKVVPVGSKVEFARTALEAKGFVCSIEYNKSYADDDGAGKLVTRPKADFLYCDSERRVDLFVSKRWQVMFPVKDGNVVSVAATVTLTGP